jgi:hypothetical protein
MATSQCIQNPSAVLRIPLTGRCGDRRVVRNWTLVANDAFGRSLMDVWWCLDGIKYAERRVNGHNVRLHRVVCEHYHGSVPDGMEVDHINRDKLDNTPGNLRIVTKTQNRTNQKKRKDNTSGYSGVCWDKQNGKWMAYITVQGRFNFLGYFSVKEAAASAVNGAYGLHYPHVQPPNRIK